MSVNYQDVRIFKVVFFFDCVRISYMVHPAEMLQNVERVGRCVRECSAVGEQHEVKQRRRAIHSAH